MTSLRLLAIAALIALTGCGTKNYCNTVKTEGDDERTIIEKAANVIPTRQQMEALDREFIAFVHFGPTPSPARNGATGSNLPKPSH